MRHLVKRSHADVLPHVLNSPGIVVNLLLHLTFVLLEVSESLLQKQILLLLSCNGSVVCVTRQLQLRYYMRHIVLVHCFKNVSHLFDFATVEF